MTISDSSREHFAAPQPSPASPIHAETGFARGIQISKYADPIWSLRTLINNPSAQIHRIHWGGFPGEHVEYFRLAIWTLLNIPMPESQGHGRVLIGDKLGPANLFRTASNFRILARWLAASNVPTMSEFTPGLMDEYAEYLRSSRRLSRDGAADHLLSITRLWLYSLEVPALAMGGTPPWVTGMRADYLPEESLAGSENRTDPIAPETISAMLNAAVRAVDHATPVLEAVALLRSIEEHGNSHLGLSGPRATEKLREYHEMLVETGTPLPMKWHAGRWVPDNPYIAYINGVKLKTAAHWTLSPDIRAFGRDHGEEVRVPLGPVGVFPESSTLIEVSRHALQLQGACFIVVAYLTGMRPGEVLALERGSLFESSQDGGWMLIRSRTFKSVRDEYGRHDPSGEIRTAPWVAVTPVVAAIRALEGLVGTDGLLFPSRWRHQNAGRSVSTYTMTARMEEFVNYVNALRPDSIPADPHGPVTTSRFRRTLAWHIANQPGGLVALAIQYGHLRTAISEGYASRTQQGIQDLIDFETARAMALRLSNAGESVSGGEGVSGPAAFRFVEALRQQAATYGGIVASARQARTFLNDTRMSVHQNDSAFVWCNFRPDTALCLGEQHSEEASSPRFAQCQSNCSNVARTDTQAEEMRQKATKMRAEAESVPPAIARRMTINAARLESLADGHDALRLTLGDLGATTG